MAVPAVNITIEKGTDFESVYTISSPDGNPLNLAGYSATAKIRKFPESTNFSSFAVGFVTSAGQVILSMGKTTTSELTNGRNYYDVLLVSPENKTSKVFEGMALVTPSASI